MTPSRSIEIAPQVHVGGAAPLLLIAGPCQIESLEHCRKIAGALKELCQNKAVGLVFKSSFDKANRTSGKSMRGIGLEKGLEILGKIRSEFKIPVLTDVHAPEQAQAAAAVVDVLQIPAFLCRQTDLLVACAKTGKAINIKKGQFLHPQDMAHVAQKIADTGNQKILLCERGSCFGYRDLVVDMRGLVQMKETGYPVIFDATHSVQSMGGESGQSGGSRANIQPLLRAALATGVHGIFVECHDNPSQAPSDGASMLPLDRMSDTLAMALTFFEAARPYR